MEGSKIRLSPAEAELMQSEEFILTKNRVLGKVRGILEGVMQRQLDFTAAYITANKLFTKPPKISRGENYLGMPWLILDYPRVAEGSDMFFIRSMFWWGRLFRSTLHLSGAFKEEYRENIGYAYPLLLNYFLGMNDDPWQHHFGEDNYQTIGELGEDGFRARCDVASHLKIAAKWPLADWEVAEECYWEHWKFFLTLTHQLPRR